MALPSTAVIEVRTTGSDSNGGGFNSARGGTDYSQQDVAQATGTVTSSTTTVTATTSIFTSAMVGNYITDGTTWKEITAFTSSTVVTVDSAPSWTAASIKVGGAIAGLLVLQGIMVESNVAYFKDTGIFDVPSNVTFSIGTALVTRTGLIGYTSTRGDGGKCRLRATSACTTILNIPGNCWQLENLELDCNNVANVGLNLGGSYQCLAVNLKVHDFKQKGIIATPLTSTLYKCEIYGGISGATFGVDLGGVMNCCYVHGNPCTGVNMGNSSVVTQSIITFNTGATGDGITCTFGFQILNNTIHGNGRHGVNYNSVYPIGLNVRSNLLTGNGGYGLNFEAFNSGNVIEIDGNAYWNNTSGARNANAGTGLIDVTLTGTPYVNAAGGNFALNNTAGAGAACRATGTPGAFPGGTTTGFSDIGAAQHQDAGGGLLRPASMAGGF